jgi:predicted ATPase
VLTRLKIDGFKNLDNVDVRFGPFTCVAGPNGVGKSNLFDAITFLAALADKPLVEAALSVRGVDSGRGDIRSLFRKRGDSSSERIAFLVEMIIPEFGEDPLGQPARASMTFLRYELRLRFRPDPVIRSLGVIEIEHESMHHINRGEAKRNLGFDHKKAWRDTVVIGRRTSPYISTEREEGKSVILLHADSKGQMGGGRPRRVSASGLPRTVLSSVNNAAEHRTLVLARQEMVSWTQLQLEPSALRAPDAFSAPRTLAPNGAHLPATLYSLAQIAESKEKGAEEDVYARVANRLSQLVEDVRGLRVDVDEKRQQFNIVLADRELTEHVAGALSDGTLRFLALTVLEADPRSPRLLCLEEPENGIHPLRIPAVIQLLRDLAVDTSEPMDDDNPLRQVIVNTHSPSVVSHVWDDALLIARAGIVTANGVQQTRLSLRPLPRTWRTIIQADIPPLSRGDLLAYLNPIRLESPQSLPGAPCSVKNRGDMQAELPFPKNAK